MDANHIGRQVRWIAAPARVGPYHDIAVDTGEIRTLVNISTSGSQVILSGKNDTGIFGWTSEDNVELVED